MTRETARHGFEKSNHGWRDALVELTVAVKRHYKRVVRRARRRNLRKEAEREWI